MAAFIKGKELCRGFFEQVAKPILDRRFPGLEYSAGLLGYGSDVLGYDDVVSTDHMWGPRFYLFLREEDKALQPHILEAFSQEFPYTYRGYSVHFSRPDPNDKGIRHAEAITRGQVDPLIFFHTFEEYLDFYLGTHHPETLADVEWLSLPEHHLLALAKEHGISVLEKPFSMVELMNADEVIVTSSSALCMKAESIDGIPVGGKDPQRLKLLQDAYLEKFQRETQPK